VGAAFFGYFLCQDKESNGPRGPEAHLGRKKAQPRSGKKNRFTAATTPHAPHRSNTLAAAL
jgi:hypothetical protein